MTIEIGSFFSGIFNKIYSVSGLNKIFSSVVYTSIILSIIVLIILVFIYPCKRGTPFWVIFKVLLYVFAINMITLSIHNSMTRTMYSENTLNNNSDRLIESITNTGGAFADDNIQVKPTLDSHGREYEVEESYEDTEPETIEELLDDVEKQI